MATAIEYGLISALIATASIVAISSLPDKSPPTAVAAKAKPQPPARFYFPTEPNQWASKIVDRKTNCRYMYTASGISVLYRKDGKVDCSDS